MIVERLPPFPTLARPGIDKIAELTYVMDPESSADSKITENDFSIPLLTPQFTSCDRNNGSPCRYIRECNENRDNNGIRRRYTQAHLITPASTRPACMRIMMQS
jgi:hypothetical protein